MSNSRDWLVRNEYTILGTLVGFVAGAAALTGFGSFVSYSNTQEFCISCHEMREFVYAEYQQSAHYKSASGVRPECADCHVPKAWLPKLWRKMQATLKELPNHFLGKIDTPEEFEAHRLTMAERVWATMKATARSFPAVKAVWSRLPCLTPR